MRVRDSCLGPSVVTILLSLWFQRNRSEGEGGTVKWYPVQLCCLTARERVTTTL